MSFISRCPYCKNAFEAEEAWIGKIAACPSCGKKIIIQRDEEKADTPKHLSGTKFTSRCPFCGSAYQALEAGIGQIMNCPGCGKQIIIQHNESNPANQCDPAKPNSAKKIFRAGCVMLEVLLLLLILASFLLPALQTAREKHRRKICTINLKLIGECIYENMNVEKLPSDYKTLTDYYNNPQIKIFTCPTSSSPYIYLGNGLVKKSGSGDTPIAMDRPDNHNGYINILYKDGRVVGHEFPDERKRTSCVDVLIELHPNLASYEEGRIVLENARKADETLFNEHKN